MGNSAAKPLPPDAVRKAAENTANVHPALKHMRGHTPPPASGAPPPSGDPGSSGATPGSSFFSKKEKGEKEEKEKKGEEGEEKPGKEKTEKIDNSNYQGAIKDLIKFIKSTEELKTKWTDKITKLVDELNSPPAAGPAPAPAPASPGTASPPPAGITELTESTVGGGSDNTFDSKKVEDKIDAFAGIGLLNKEATYQKEFKDFVDILKTNKFFTQEGLFESDGSKGKMKAVKLSDVKSFVSMKKDFDKQNKGAKKTTDAKETTDAKDPAGAVDLPKASDSPVESTTFTFLKDNDNVGNFQTVIKPKYNSKVEQFVDLLFKAVKPLLLADQSKKKEKIDAKAEKKDAKAAEEAEKAKEEEAKKTKKNAAKDAVKAAIAAEKADKAAAAKKGGGTRKKTLQKKTRKHRKEKKTVKKKTVKKKTRKNKKEKKTLQKKTRKNLKI